jgi:hypothetical protein
VSKKVSSISTPGKRVGIETRLIEIAITRRQRGQVPPPDFWKLNKYKWVFRKEIQAVKKFIKKYGAAAVIEVVSKNYLTSFTDYASMEFLLQAIEERQKRLNLPKDISNVKNFHKENKKDLRGSGRRGTKKTGLFEKLERFRS